MDDGSEEDLLWVLDKQKEDYLEMKKQARRYLLGVISFVILISGLIVQFGFPIMSKEYAISGLMEHDILWQLEILGPQYARAFVETLFPLPIIIVIIGILFFRFGIEVAYEIEKDSGYQPMGDVGTVLEEKPWEVREWIEKNDELISSIDDGRVKAMEFAQIGVSITVGGILLMATLHVLIILFFPVLIWMLVLIFTSFHTEDHIENSNFQKLFGSILIFMLGSRPLLFLQKLEVDFVPAIALYLDIPIVVIITVLYFLHGDSMYDYIAN